MPFTVLEKAEEVGSLGGTNINLEQMGMLTPQLCEYPGNRREQQRQKVISRVATLIPGQNSVNERAPFPRVYASLITSLGEGEQ